MKEEDILNSLCWYDERNPNYNKDDAEFKQDDCYCDNCFRGKHELANYILELTARSSRD